MNKYNKFDLRNKVTITQGPYKGKIGLICDILYDENTGRYKYRINTIEDNDYLIDEDDISEGKYHFENFMRSKIRLYDEPMSIYEMAGRLKEVPVKGTKNKKTLIIAVGSDENRGQAHFHVFRNSNDVRDWKNGACICFDKNQYFDHKNHNEILTKDELATVKEYLNKLYPTTRASITNWEHIVDLWNNNGNVPKIDPNILMPQYDYKTITRYKK